MNEPLNAVPDRPSCQASHSVHGSRKPTYRAWLIAAYLLPGVIGGTILLIDEYRENSLERDEIRATRTLLRAVDSQLLKAQVAVNALGASGVLARQDFASFHRQALDLLAWTGGSRNRATNC